MGAQNTVKDWPLAPNEMKLKAKYLAKRPGNVGHKKGGNSGGCGRKALSAKRGKVVCSRTSPEQWGRYMAWAASVNFEILG